MSKNIQIRLLQAKDEQLEFDHNLDYPAQHLEELTVVDEATPMFFVVVSIPNEGAKQITDEVQIESFIDPDALPAKTVGTLKSSDSTHAHYISFRDPVVTNNAREMTINVRCGDLRASRKVALKRK